MEPTGRRKVAPDDRLREAIHRAVKEEDGLLGGWRPSQWWWLHPTGSPPSLYGVISANSNISAHARDFPPPRGGPTSAGHPRRLLSFPAAARRRGARRWPSARARQRR